MNEKLNEALNEISDKHLAEAITPKKKTNRKIYWLGAVAAVLALVILLNSGGLIPAAHAAGLIAAPEYPEMVPYPQDPNGAYDTKEYQDWTASLLAQYDQPKGYADGLDAFFTESIPLFLTESDENAVCSPLNIYMALAMLAETTGGESRGSILAALNAESIDSLRTQAGHVWNAHYRADGSSACLLANSLWLNEGYTFDRSTVNTLADSYYASVYQGDLDSDKMNAALRAWLSVQTDGLLDGYLDQVQFAEDTALTLASTVYYRARWDGGFSSENNSTGTFHSPTGDILTTFMNKTMYYGPYYYGEDYGAVRLELDSNLYDDGGMWLILPDEGYDVWDILESGHAMNAILTGESQNSTEVKVYLSVPKFDISAETDLREGFTALGLGALYDPDTADFTSILPDTQGVSLDKTTHAARVAIDEEGVTATAYTLMQFNGALAPPEEEVYFTLDRPFLFVITSHDGLPLFTGVVNEP